MTFGSAARAIEGEDSLDNVRGACGTMPVERVKPSPAIRNLIITCPSCWRRNDAEKKGKLAPRSIFFLTQANGAPRGRH